MSDSALDDAMDAFANDDRRRLLVELRGDDTHVEVSARSRGVAPTEDSAIEMFHRHLPKLDDYGFIEWDRVNDTVYRGPRFEELDPLMEVVEEGRTDLPSSDL